MRWWTGAFLLLISLALIIWDVYLFNFGENQTISVIITDFSYNSLPLVFVIGFLCGHWFWPAKRSKD